MATKAPRQTLRLQLTAEDYAAFVQAIDNSQTNESPRRVMRALISAYCRKYSGTPLVPASPAAREDIRASVDYRRCRVCDKVKPAIDFSGTRFHTVCRFCVTTAAIKGNKRPGTPTDYLANQYHYRKIRNEYIERSQAGDPGLPSWAEYQKQQKPRLQASRKEYFEKLKGR